jgi:hypothetical protein
MTLYLRLIAGRTTSSAAQALLASIDDVRDTLAANQALTPSIWRALWNSKPDVKLASTLVGRQLDVETVELVLEREKRVTVLEALVKKCHLSDDHARRLLGSTRMTSAIASSWFDARTAPSAVGYDLAMRSGVERAIRYALAHRELSTDQTLALLRKSSTHHAKGMSTFVDTRPEMLSTLTKDEHIGLRTAALCSRHMFDQELIFETVTTAKTTSWWQWSEMVLAVIHSPNTTPETITRLTGFVRESSDDHAGARSVSTRIEAAAVARLREFPYAVLRPWESADTAEERVLLERCTSRNMERAMIVNSLRQAQPVPVVRRQETNGNDPRVWHEDELRAFSLVNHPPVGSVAALVAYLDRHLDALGNPGWEIAIGLLRSPFDGSVSDLLSVTESLI